MDSGDFEALPPTEEVDEWAEWELEELFLRREGLRDNLTEGSFLMPR